MKIYSSDLEGLEWCHIADVEMPNVVLMSPSLPLPGTSQTEWRDVTAVLSNFDIPH